MIAALLILATLGLGYSMPVPSGTYIQTGECQVDEVCAYTYNVNQQFGRDESQNLTFSATVEIACHSVGQFSNTSATQYCMTVVNAKVDGAVFNETSDEAKQKNNDLVNQLLSQWFCFVQTVNGKVVVVQHASNEKLSAVDIKKSIAAAFQANFNGTEEEVESDPQSDHVSHYRHIPSDTNVKKMHRHIEGDDVIYYSSGANGKRVKLLKDEDIEYRNGFLYQSSGTTEIKMKGQNEDEVEYSISEAFVAEGSYALDLKQCSIIEKHTQTRRRRRMSEDMNKDLMEEGLKVQRDQAQQVRERMVSIRESIPAIPNALSVLHKDQNNYKLFDLLEELLELEYQYGTPPGKSCAVKELFAYLEMFRYSNQPHDVKMREIIYALLSKEGSLQSQMALIEALQFAVSHTERETIITVISMIPHAHMAFVTTLQEYIQESGDPQEKDALLLSFGILASTAQHNVELVITNFLVEQLQTATNGNDTSALVHLLLAMGNTGSKLVMTTVLNFIDYEIRDVQDASIIALVKFTHIREVQDALQEVLASDPDEDTISRIMQTLARGQLYAEGIDLHIEIDLSHPMFSTLVTVVLNTNNTDLMNQVSIYLRKAGGEQATEMLEQLHARLRRGTNWDEHNSDYDCVAPQSSRARDVVTYPKHNAYIYGKRVGNNDVNMKVRGGVFVGISNDCNSMKGFARACARANFFSESKGLAEIEFSVVKAGATITGRAYFQFGGNTLLNYQLCVDTTHGFIYHRSLYEPRQRLFRFSYSFWIYAGSVEASISLYFRVNMNFEAKLYANTSVNELLSTTAAIVPQVSLTVDGTASYTFIGVARVGLTAEAELTYQIEPRATGKVCTTCSSLDYQICAGLYNSWPGNSLSLYAWYQLRRVEWCEGWFGISYPCGFGWSSKKRWDALSWTWSLGSRSKTTIAEYCYPSSSTCPASPLAGPVVTTQTAADLQWPGGQYSLIQAASGCPTCMSSGWRFQDNEDSINANSWSPANIASFINIDVGRDFKTYYCTKTSTAGTTSWPRGTYCIARYGSSCPSSFSSGSMYWDDEDSGNTNRVSNPVPSGWYGSNTQINFCCRSDGNHNTPIALPTTRAFALYRYGGRCQRVSGMNSPTELSIHFDDEDSNNANSCFGSRPDGPCGRDHTLTFCYYSPL